MVTLRLYRLDDAPALLALVRDTVRRVNSRDYSPVQVAAWRPTTSIRSGGSGGSKGGLF